MHVARDSFHRRGDPNPILPGPTHADAVRGGHESWYINAGSDHWVLSIPSAAAIADGIHTLLIADSDNPARHWPKSP